MKLLKKGLKYILLAFILFMIYNSIKIYHYSFAYSEKKSDVAIILGAGTNNGTLSPVFRERINHSIYLYENQFIKKIIFTGGIGENQNISDSQIAKNYAIELGIPPKDMLIEEYSHYTYENVLEAKIIMDKRHFSTALIVTDPLHSKRAMELAISAKIDCKPSPTKTSMFRTTIPKIKFLGYETFFYTIGKLTLKH